MNIRSLVETARCTKHNLVDRPSFRLSFENGFYCVRTAESFRLRFVHNPYLAFYEITAGYLQGSQSPLRPGMFVLDAGACDGEFALYASRCVGPGGLVLALEPDPQSFKSLQATFEINGGVPAHVKLLQAALWKHSGELAFSGGNHLSSRLLQCGDEGNQSFQIPVHSLADLVVLYGLPRLDFVKMDIEGAEIEAMEGAASVLTLLRPKFAIASYHVRNGRPTAECLNQMFLDASYTSTTGFPQHLTTYAAPTVGGLSAS